MKTEANEPPRRRRYAWDYILAPIPPEERLPFLRELGGAEFARLIRLALVEEAGDDMGNTRPRKPSVVRGLTQERYRSKTGWPGRKRR